MVASTQPQSRRCQNRNALVNNGGARDERFRVKTRLATWEVHPYPNMNYAVARIARFFNDVTLPFVKMR